MALHIRDQETDQAVRKLARKTGESMTDAVRIAATERLERIERAEAESRHRERPFIESIRDIQEFIASFPRTGLKADKAFFDELSGDA